MCLKVLDIVIKFIKKIKCFEEKLNMSCFGKNCQMLELVELSTPWP